MSGMTEFMNEGPKREHVEGPKSWLGAPLGRKWRLRASSMNEGAERKEKVVTLWF